MNCESAPALGGLIHESEPQTPGAFVGDDRPAPVRRDRLGRSERNDVTVDRFGLSGPVSLASLKARGPRGPNAVLSG